MMRPNICVHIQYLLIKNPHKFYREIRREIAPTNYVASIAQ